MFSNAKINFFGFVPSPALVKFCCILGLVGYPIMFLIFVIFMMAYLQKKKQLVWNEEFEKYTDVECREIKVTVPSQVVPGFVPVASQLLTSHARG